MDVRLAHVSSGAAFAECCPSGAPLAREEDATVLVEFCLGHRTRAVLLHENALAEAFFDLGTGLAGCVLQKLAIYHICAALVVTGERHLGGRFGEMVREANRGNQFRVFAMRETATAWLTAT